MSPTQISILVVEDENIVAKDLQSRLRRLGYTVPAIASSGEDAIARAEEVRPDLIFMDIGLRGSMDGIEAASRIMGSLRIPVVFLTAYTDDSTLDRAKRAGPFGYLGKPLEDHDLLQTLKQFTLQRQKAQS